MDSVLLPHSQYHNPRLNIANGLIRDKVYETTKDFLLSRSTLVRVQRVLRDEMSVGLALNPTRKSSLIMAITYVTEFFDGTERGDYISLDLGSTNFRVLLSRLRPPPDGDEFRVKHYTVPNEYRRGESRKLFDFLAASVADFIGEHLPDSRQRRLPLGFTFSFPMRQEAIDVGVLETWTKNFDCPDAVGRNAAQLLAEAIDRRSDLLVDVVAIMNDTTGTLVRGVYREPDCAISVIIGSGSNACYIERVDRIEKWTDRAVTHPNAREVIVDMECGGFGDNGVIDFAKTRFDADLDRESLFPRSYTFEKLYGGQFLGDIVRRVLVSLVGQNCLFGGIASAGLEQPNSISAADVSLIETGEQSVGAQYFQELAKRLGYDSMSANDIEIVRYVCAVVSVRGATILSAVLATLVDRLDRSRLTIAIDGSVYEKHPKFHTLMTDFIGELCASRQFRLTLAEDGSGIGAGLVAAIATKSCRYKYST